MTVWELRKALEQFAPNAEVVVSVRRGRTDEIVTVTKLGDMVYINDEDSDAL